MFMLVFLRLKLFKRDDYCKQVERGAAFYLSGIREKYFGEVFLNASRCLGDLQSDGIKTTLFEEMRSDYDLLETYESVHGLGSKWSFENKFPNKFRTMRATFEEGLSHIARYVESFESRSNEIWLVFRHEGVSLSKLIYTVEEVENVPDREKVEEVKRFEVLQPSKWWHWLKTTKAGKEEMRNLIWQLVCLLTNLTSIIMCSDFLLTQPLVSLMFIWNLAMVGLGVVCCCLTLVFTQEVTQLFKSKACKCFTRIANPFAW